VGFTSIALKLFGLHESLQDEAFEKGQLRDAKDLGDSGTERAGIFYPDWDVEFKADIHGIFQITAHDDDIAKIFIDELEDSFRRDLRRSSIKKILLFRAAFRPQPHTLNEHFGFRDGISKPEVDGVTFFPGKPMRFPGSPIVGLGLLVMGFEGDEDKASRPQWAVGGSFLVFRKLKSLVPEYNDFALREGMKLFPNLSPEKASDRFGARLFGRWKSGENCSPGLASLTLYDNFY
jgi:deferrochelatase/peroxidase EfeB